VGDGFFGALAVAGFGTGTSTGAVGDGFGALAAGFDTGTGAVGDGFFGALAADVGTGS